MATLKEIEGKLVATGETQISLTDSDARSMMTRGAGIVGYNVQTAVDTRHHLIVEHDGAEVGKLPVQAGQLEQALRHAHRLPQLQIERALDGQAELDRRLALLRVAAPHAVGTAVPVHVLVQPDQQRAAKHI